MEQTKQWVRKHNRFRQPKPNSVVFSVCAKVLFLKWCALSSSLLHAYAYFQSYSSCLYGCEAVLEYQRNLPLSHARFSRCCERLRRHHNCKSSTCQLRQVIRPTEPASQDYNGKMKRIIASDTKAPRQRRRGGGENRIKRVMMKKI